MTLILPAKAVAAIVAHAEATYPDECVGLLVGTLNGEQKTVLQVVTLENRWSGQVQLAPTDDPTSRRDRFYLDPRDYLRAERAARAAGYEIIGCYHCILTPIQYPRNVTGLVRRQLVVQAFHL